MVFLQSHGVGTSRAVRIYKTYGEQAVERVRENPYRLALDIHGIGFRTADAIAQRLGIPRDSLIRAQAGVRHVLQEIAGEGHCAALREKLAETASQLLEIPPPIIEQAIACGVRRGKSDRRGHRRTSPRCFSHPSIVPRKGMARHLPDSSEATAALGRGRHRQGDPLGGEENRAGPLRLPAAAVAMAVNGKVTVITGGPGVGKTTVVNSILRIMRAKGANVLLCAPTGRAAKRPVRIHRRRGQDHPPAARFRPQDMGFRRDPNNPLETGSWWWTKCRWWTWR